METQNTRIGNSIFGVLEGLWGRTRSIDSWNRIDLYKRGNRRLLDKVFELKPIKRGGKILFRQPKYSLELLQQHRTHVFPEQQQLHNSSHLPQPLYLKKIKQYRPGTINEERERRLDKTIPQDIERDISDDQCAEDGKEFKENGRRNQYDDHRNERNNSDGQYQQ